MTLAVLTGVPAAAWRDEDERTLVTALALLEQGARRRGG